MDGDTHTSDFYTFTSESDNMSDSECKEIAFMPDSMRRKHENPLNLTQYQLDEKAEQIARLKQLYPDVDSYWADIICDICMTKTQEEINLIKARVGSFKRDYSNLQNELNLVKDNWVKS
jgi:hypothetical protein